MHRPIIAFGVDDAGDPVAFLSCGHPQHVRHQPPFINRPWVTTEAGRRSKLGEMLNCVRCDRSGTVSSIFIAETSLGPPEAVAEARLAAGSGIVGDRRCRDGAPPKEELTLVESEQIDAFNERTGLDVPYRALRRNLLTRGIGLADLVGVRFRIGEAEAEGIELCEPCATVGRLLSTDEVPPKRVIRELMHRAGLRARIVTSGVIRPGDALEPVGTADAV